MPASKGAERCSAERSPAERSSAAELRSALLCVIAVLFLAGCATRAPVLPRDLLALTGSDAGMHLVVPVARNAPLARFLAASSRLSDYASSAALDPLLERADVLYAGVYSGRLTLVITGDFPKNASAFAFPASAGWKKHTSKPYGVWYERGPVRASIPATGVVLATVDRADPASDQTSGKTSDAPVDPASTAQPEELAEPAITAMLKTFAVPQTDTSYEARLSPGFRAFARDAFDDGRIGLFVNDPSALESALFGSLLEIPVQWAEIYASPQPDADGASAAAEASSYLVSAEIELADERTVRAFSLILRLALGTAVEVDGKTLSITGVPVSASVLADSARFLYF